MSQKVPTGTLPISGRRTLTVSDNSLLDLAHTKASFIWVPESDPTIGQAPAEQRAFRKTYTPLPNRPAPSNATIFLAADDDFALYINGVLVHPADATHDDDAMEAYHVPLPVVDQADNKSLVVAARVINKGGGAGLLVAVQVNYPDSGGPDIFYTGGDQSWLGERYFQEHWEQPWFDGSAELSTWRPAMIWNTTARNPANAKLIRDEVVEFKALPALADPASSACGTSGASTGGTGGKSNGVSPGGVAGAVVGTAILALALGAFLGWFVTKKKLGRGNHRSRVSYDGVAEPTYPAAAEVALVASSYQPPQAYLQGPGLASYQPSGGVSTMAYQPGAPSIIASQASTQGSSSSAAPLYQPETKAGRRVLHPDHEMPPRSPSPPPPPFVD
ncbi:hypothetical protein DFP72DRAFT_867904 [Ephemerocybe angulata]|uniref:Uncharacterized protein n=1 Tax=Ephemerocybe angulata TaxID=980116 RepID=A0A8H6IJP0_9AGAR|nr:hypothetical protein DFP72DRAFT_867904 [Tulosesus angulatus]